MKKFFAQVTALVVAVVMFVACGDAQKQGNYTNIIPTDASILIQADLYEVAEQGGIIELVAPYRAQLADMASARGGQFLKDIAMDLNNTGIATDQPVYGYMKFISENNVEIGAVAKVCDRAKLDKTATYLEETLGEITVKQKDGNTIITFDEEDVPFIIGFNDCALVAYAHGKNNETVTTTNDVVTLLDKAFVERATPFTPTTSDVNVTIDYKDLAWAIDAEQLAEEAPEIQVVINYLLNCTANLDYNIEDGGVSYKLTMSNPSAEAKEMINSFFTKVENTHIDYVAANALAAVNININETMKTQVSNALDAYMEHNSYYLSIEDKAGMEMAKECLKTLGGDVTLSLEDINLQSGEPKVKVIASTNNPALKGLFTMAALAVDGLNVAGDDTKTIAAFGTTTSPVAPSATSSSWYNDLKDKVGYGVLNIKALMSKPEVRSQMREELEWDMEPEMVEAVMAICDLADYAAIYSEVENGGAECSIGIELKLKERNTNLLKQVVNILEPLIAEAAADYM